MMKTLALAAVMMVATPAYAQHRGDWEPAERMRPVPVLPHERMGPRYERHHARRFFHGQWFDYGVGPCWRQQMDGSYVWICDDE